MKCTLQMLACIEMEIFSKELEILLLTLILFSTPINERGNITILLSVFRCMILASVTKNTNQQAIQ